VLQLVGTEGTWQGELCAADAALLAGAWQVNSSGCTGHASLCLAWQHGFLKCSRLRTQRPGTVGMHKVLNACARCKLALPTFFLPHAVPAWLVPGPGQHIRPGYGREGLLHHARGLQHAGLRRPLHRGASHAAAATARACMADTPAAALSCPGLMHLCLSGH